MLIHKTLLTVVGLSLLALPSLAAQPPGAESLTTTRVRENLYQVSGGGANAFFHVADDEVLALVASIEKKQAQVKPLVDQGKTLDEVTAALAPADQPVRPAARPVGE